MASPVPTNTSVYKVVLTGGPCAGKTSSLALITDHFQSMGWRVYVVQEAATIVLGGGVPFQKLNTQQVFNLQLSIAKVMMSIENTYTSLAYAASQNENTLILCDRGIMDASVYCSPETWKRILEDLDLTEMDVKDKRYDGVIHLVSTANGAEEFYNRDTNTVRSESPEEARKIDNRTLNAWVGHPRLTVVDNSTNFKDKVLRAVCAICKIVGVDEPSASITKRKFLVTNTNLLIPTGEDITFRDSECEYVFLLSSDSGQHRIRSRGTQGIFTYTHTVRYAREDGTYSERKRTLRKREYQNLLNQKDPARSKVRLQRKSFGYKQQYFELSIYEEPKSIAGLMLLEAYSDNKSALNLPTQILSIKCEVTGQPAFSMHKLASLNCPGIPSV